jgi:nitrite reductase (NADH) small subunit
MTTTCSVHKPVLRSQVESDSIMPNWIRIAAVADCPPGSAFEAVADDRIVALFNVEGQFYALDGICPHQGGPLGQGRLSGCVVTCPWHGWQFDVKTGQHQINKSIVHPRLEVKVSGEEVFVDVQAASSAS